jgi:hypothetical protein
MIVSRFRPDSSAVPVWSKGDVVPDDTLDDLVRRADDALVEARGNVGRSRPD